MMPRSAIAVKRVAAGMELLTRDALAMGDSFQFLSITRPQLLNSTPHATGLRRSTRDAPRRT